MHRIMNVLAVSLLLGVALTGHTAAADPANEKSRAEQLQDLRFGMFVCWSFSTFSGYEWTPGVEDIRFFNPTGFDPDQWCRTAKEAEMGYILLLTKHHDGFCLWDTQTTDRKATNSPLGVDVVAEVKQACDRHGLKLALYFSEGDWSWSGRKDIHTSAERPEIKAAQLRELLTQYGPIEYIWFDHAVGDGGLSHEETAKLVKSIQPGCFVGFNHGEQDGADLRIGERGKPGPLDDITAESIGSEKRASYMLGHTGYQLAEFTYPILEGQKRQKTRGAQWFYSLPENDDIAASPEKIYKDYLGAEKFGNIFSLDVGPDRNGKLRKIDVDTLRKVGQYIRGEITLPPEPMEVQGANASNVWENDPGYGPEKAFDGDPGTRWGADEDSREGWIECDLGQPVAIQTIIIDEGEWDRVEKFELLVRQGDGWRLIHRGERIGSPLQITFDEPIAGQVFRLNILQANEVPTVCEMELYEAE